MTHKEAVKCDAVDRYLLRQLSEKDEREFKKHLSRCESCKEELEAARIFVANLRAVFVAEQKRRERRGRRPRRT